MVCSLIDEAAKDLDSGLGRFVGWVFKAAILTVLVVAAAFILYGSLNSG